MNWLDIVSSVSLIVILACTWWQIRDLTKRIEKLEKDKNENI
ncbi:hypothetical protein [Helicobacter sp. 13S00477-4]|nr:hypothetical protein [Helicobacter sp. 13S00477-4]